MDYLPDLTDKVAIVTGGGKGIGRAIAFGLAEAGCKVIIAARTESEIQDTAKDITSRGGQAIAKVTDLTRNEDIQ
jgi:NAD(P)-dependent dehydrogenase (short-subunit alcohol dehydrogenase family)